MTDTPQPPRRSSHDLACTPVIRGYMKQWFARLHERVADGEPYVIAPARTPHEIMEAFDIPYVSNEWWSGIVAAQRRSGDYFNLLEERGYHSDLARYSALSFADALQQDDPERPWGGLPKPAFILYPGAEADIARVEAQAEAWDVPAISGGVVPPPARIPHRWWDVSRWMWEDLYDTARIDCMVDSYRDIIAACEKLTGKRFDPDRLREIMERVARQESYFEDARTVMRKAPKVPVSLAEEMGNVMTIQWLRGSEWALEAAKSYRDEVVDRAAKGIAICPEERVRLSWNSVGLWQKTSFYRAFEKSHGAVFLRSMYMSIACDGYPRYGLGDPLRALASRYAAIVNEIAVPPASTEWEIHEAREFRVNGVVTLPNRDHLRFPETALEGAGIPTLVIPVDAVDGRSWDEEKINAMVGEFIETRALRHV